MTTLRQVTRNVSWTACLLAIAGCQTTLPLDAMKQPTFAVGQVASTPATAVSTAGNALAGSLTVSFQGVLAAARQRRVLSSVAEVDHVTVTVKTSDGATQTQTVAKAAIVGGQTTVTFIGLPPGLADLTVEAFDAAGKVIGSTLKVATVTSGQTATVPISLQLTPTYAGSPGGGGSANTGSLAANVTLLDGEVIHADHSGEVLGTYTLSQMGTAVAVDGSGNAWVGRFGMGGPSRLLKVSPDGQELLNIELGDGFSEIMVDSHDHVWAMDGGTNGFVYEVAQDGTVLNKYSSHSSLYVQDAEMDAAGNIYILQATTTNMGDPLAIDRLTPQGVLSTFSLDGSGFYDLAVNAQGDMWGTTFHLTPTNVVGRLSAAGQPLPALAVGTGELQMNLIAIDSLGNPWVTADFSLKKLSPQGTVLKSIPLSNQPTYQASVLQADGWGGMWYFDRGKATHYDRSGEVVSSTVLATSSTAAAVGKSGVWALLGPDGDKLVRLAP